MYITGGWTVCGFNISQELLGMWKRREGSVEKRMSRSFFFMGSLIVTSFVFFAFQLPFIHSMKFSNQLRNLVACSNQTFLVEHMACGSSKECFALRVGEVRFCSLNTLKRDFHSSLIPLEANVRRFFEKTWNLRWLPSGVENSVKLCTNGAGVCMLWRDFLRGPVIRRLQIFKTICLYF